MATYIDFVKENVTDGAKLVAMMDTYQGGCLQCICQDTTDRLDEYVWDKWCRRDHNVLEPYRYCNECKGKFWEQEVRSIDEIRQVVRELKAENKPVPMGLCAKE